MDDMVECISGPFAVVIPVDPGERVRVIDWPTAESLGALYREIGCSTVDLRVVGGPRGLGVWVDDEGALGSGWAANGRAAWLARMVDDSMVLVAGTVVVTLAEPDRHGEVRGLSRGLADLLAGLAQATPAHDVDGLTALLRELVDRDPVVMTFDENGVPDGFFVV